MKNLQLICATLILLVYSENGFTQDTIKLENSIVYSCQILKITETEVEFKRWDNLQGPIYSVNKSSVIKIIYKNGLIELFSSGEIKKKPAKLLNMKNCIKLDFFAPVFNKITIGFEKCHHYGFNSEIYINIISNQLSKNLYQDKGQNGYSVQGVGFKYGAKYLIGNYLPIKNTNYVHPLRGTFFRVDLSFAQYSVLNAYTYEYTPWPAPYLYRVGSLNVSQLAFGFSFGYQAMIGNSLMLQTNFGAGYCGGIIAFKLNYESNYLDPESRGYNYDPDNFTMSNYGNVQQLSTTPIYLSANITLGYVLGKKENREKIPSPQSIFID